MKLPWLLIVHTVLFSGVAEATDCSKVDKDLVFCPAPRAPTITELRAGSVTLEISVNADGSVASSTVVASAGHAAWIPAAQTAVAAWRYSTGVEGRRRVVPFEFGIGQAQNGIIRPSPAALR
jgi:TonB family protein